MLFELLGTERVRGEGLSLRCGSALLCLTNRRRQRPRSELGSGGADLSKLNCEAGCEKIDPHPKLTNLRKRGVGRAKGLRGTESRGGAGPDGNRGPEEYQPASWLAEERGLQAAADPARGRRRAPLETEPEQRRSARQAGGQSAEDRAGGADR